MYILCRNREKVCATASEHIFYVEDCVTASERKCAAGIFFYVGDCMTAFRNTLVFSNERAAAS